MGTITLFLKDDVEKILREVARYLYGSKKGSLSKVVEDALNLYRHVIEEKEKRCFYKAYKGDTLVAEASSIDELAEKVRSKGVDVRGLRIISSKPLNEKIRSGYRFRSR